MTASSSVRRPGRDAGFTLFDVVPTGAAIGATVHIPDVKALDAAQARELRRAWLKYGVVRIPGQQLDEAQQIAFGRWFGDFQITNPLPNPLTREDLGTARAGLRQAPRDERYPEITVVSNVVRDGQALGGLGDGELVWHSDMSQFAEPPSATIAYGVEIPRGKGNTLFASVAHAAGALPADEFEFLSALSIKHDEVFDAAGLPRRGYDLSLDPSRSPGRVQPMIIEHPETGRPVLFLGRRRHAYVPGLSLQESDALLDRLWAYATEPRFQWAHEWEQGDIAMWDNRSVLHKRESFGDAPRLLRRVVIRGSAPRPYRSAAATADAA